MSRLTINHYRAITDARTLASIGTPRCPDVILVCGPYKSGTSLAVHRLVTLGWHDPSIHSNPREYGYGCAMIRYPTRECAIVRSINDHMAPFDAATGRYLPRRRGRASHLTRTIRDYIAASPRPLVLKDPRFLYTSHMWIDACASVGVSVGILLLIRSKTELSAAWDVGPLTRRLLRTGVLLDMLMAQQRLREVATSQGFCVATCTLSRLRMATPRVGYTEPPFLTEPP